VIENGNADGCHALGHFAILTGESLLTRLLQHRAQLPVAAWRVTRPVGERTSIREQCTQLGGGQGGKQRSAARRQVARQPHADSRDEGWPARRPLFDDVDHIPPVQNCEVCALTDLIDQAGDQAAAKVRERLLPRIP
jgi:hypothetical protein